MGRREDGAAVKEGPEMRSESHRVGETGKSRRRSMRRRGFGATHSGPPGDGGAPLPGIRTRRQELADRRGWSTFSKARPVLIAERRRGAPGGAFLRFATEERDARKTSHRACFADRPPGASQAPAPAGAPLPSMGAGNCNSQRGPARGRPNNTGDDARPIVIPGRERERANPESILRSIRNRMSAVPHTSTAAYGFRVRPLAGPPRNDGLFESERRRRVHILRSFPRKRESSADSQLGPRCRGDERR